MPGKPGTLPIALGIGVGAELCQPLGVAVVDGLVVSRFQTLCTTPAIYLYPERWSRASRPVLMPVAGA